MATVWIYPPEILPLKIRAKGAALAAAADFLGNFLVVEITPPALRNIGYKTYIIFAIFNLCNAFIVWMFYPETGGLELESVDRLFVGREEDEYEDRGGNWKGKRLRSLQWNFVRKAGEMRRNERGRRRVFGEVSSEDTVVEYGKGYSEQVEVASSVP